MGGSLGGSDVRGHGMDQRRLTAGSTERDVALWFTERIVETLRARRFDELQPVATPFRTALGAGEVMLAEGPFELSTFRPVGDGSYVQRSTAVLPIGRRALGLAAGALVANGMANRRRRAAAAAAATPRWVVDDGGTLWVATHGFYLQTARGLYPWPWQSIAAAELVGPGQTHLQGTSDSGQVSWIIGSRWAELLFALWAMVRHPAHPQFVTRTWATHRPESVSDGTMSTQSTDSSWVM